MKRENGFTLIELLAVIVILTMIALITTPIVLNIINNAKKGASKNSMYGYVEAIELEEAKARLLKKERLTGTYTTKDGDLYLESEKVLDVPFKGDKPIDGGSVELVSGRVKKAELTFGGNLITYEGSVSSGTTPSPTPVPTPDGYTADWNKNDSNWGQLTRYYAWQTDHSNRNIIYAVNTETVNAQASSNFIISGEFKAGQTYNITVLGSSELTSFSGGIYDMGQYFSKTNTTMTITPTQTLSQVSVGILFEGSLSSYNQKFIIIKIETV